MSLGTDVYVANLDTDTLDAATKTPARNHPLRNHLNLALRRCSRLARGGAPQTWLRRRQGRRDQP
jgi:hypothetical protein